MNSFNNIIIFDTEFIFAKENSQPIQIAFSSFEVIDDYLLPLDDYNVYIKTLSNTKLNKYVTRITGIDEKILDEKGIQFKRARKEVLRYLHKFNSKKTILIGWDIHNDQSMFDKLFNRFIHFQNVNKYRWIDLGKIYKRLKKLNSMSSLKNACNEYNIDISNWHNAKDDIIMTKELLICLIKEYGIDKVLYESFESKYTKKRHR